MKSFLVFFVASFSLNAPDMNVSAKAYKSNLRRTATDPTACPCFSFDYDSLLIEATIDTIDFHREKSCTSNNPNMERLYWTPIATSERPNSAIILPIDGIKYNYIKAVYDTDVEYYSCERGDYRMPNIQPSEAQACMKLVSNACNESLPEMCQSFDLSVLEKIKENVEIGDIVLDIEKSCNSSSDSYGIYAEDEDKALAVSDGTTHCSSMIRETCSRLKADEGAESDTTKQ